MAGRELFDAVLTHHEVSRDPRLSLLIWWAARCAELGFTPSYGPGDHGNLSCRTALGCLITARATTKATLRAEEIVEILGVERPPECVRVLCRGFRLPSTDTLLHLMIYQTRPDVQAIIHGHDAQALAKAVELRLPITVRSASVQSRDLIEEICQLVRGHAYILLRDHGFVAVGRSLDEAGELARRMCTLARSR